MAKQQTKRFYHATSAVIELKIRAKNGTRIGTLTIDPNVFNGLSWLRKNKHEKSRKNKTFLNLVKWMES